MCRPRTQARLESPERMEEAVRSLILNLAQGEEVQ